MSCVGRDLTLSVLHTTRAGFYQPEVEISTDSTQQNSEQYHKQHDSFYFPPVLIVCGENNLHHRSRHIFCQQFVSSDTCGQDRSKLANWFIKHGAPEDLEDPAPFYVGPVLDNPYDNPDNPPTGWVNILFRNNRSTCSHFSHFLSYRASLL